MKKIFLAIYICVCGWASGSAQGLIESAHDCSHRVSLINKVTLATFENDADGFLPGEGVEAAVSDSGRAFYPNVHEGKKALWVKSKTVSGDTWRTVTRTFSKPLNLRQTPFVQFAVFAQTSPVQDQYVRLTLRSAKDKFECVAHIIPTLWRTLAFDCSECPFLGSIKSMEIALCSPTPDLWETGRDYLIDGIVAGTPIDFDFTTPLSISPFRTESGKITYESDALVYSFKKPGSVYTTLLGGSINSIFNPPAKNRNTVRAVIANRCGADSIRVSYITDKDSLFENHSKTFALSKDEELKNYFFNFSDIPTQGNYAGLKFEPIGAHAGSIAIDRITFEREAPLTKTTGKVTQCKADSANIHIALEFSPAEAAKYKELEIYSITIDQQNFRKGKKIYSTQNLSASMKIDNLPLARADRPTMTHLATRFVAALSNGDEKIQVGQPFYISNWEDFTENPYDFLVTNEDFNVLDYGAKGDGFTDDTRAFQLAINAASGAGSGRVVVPGSDDPYGRRYIITSIELKHDVEFRLEKGAVLWQSGDVRDYKRLYSPLYGHDMVIPGVPWTHSHFSNLPMIYACKTYRIKIAGQGTLRMNDPYTRDPDIAHYAQNCEDRIHIVPLVIVDSHDIVLQDFDIIRTNCYHTSFNNDSNMFIGNVKMYDPACVSGDGISVSSGTHRMIIERCVFSSNDDGVTLCSSYRDPRDNVSPWRDYHDLDPHGARLVKVEHSYFNSGAGKAIALIPWGSTNPEPQRQIIDSVTVTDCVLRGGYSVGTWPDNPFDGKPFTNGETDDFSTVQDFRIFNNEYQSECNLLCVTPTNFRNDCGIPSSATFMNPAFKDGRCYWSRIGEARISREGAEVGNGQTVFQGLTLAQGKYSATFTISGNGTAFAEKENGFGTDEEGTTPVASLKFSETSAKEITLSFTVSEKSDIRLGIRGGKAKLTLASLKNQSE